MTVKGYLEKPRLWAEEIAVFEREDAYSAVIEALEQWAKNEDPSYIITESFQDD